MTDKVQKIRAFLVGIADTDGVSTILARAIEKKILPYIDSLQEEPVSEDLEEAAEMFIDSLIPTEVDTVTPFAAEYVIGLLNKAIEFGAKWQKEQLMANTADAMIRLPYENKDGGYTHLIDVSRPLPVGNNKIAIIFKED